VTPREQFSIACDTKRKSPFNDAADSLQLCCDENN